MNNEKNIIKEKIIAYVIIKAISGKRICVYARPITLNWEGLDFDSDVDQDEEVIAVVPAINDYRIIGFDEDGNGLHLGYELGSSYHPNWNQKLKDEIKIKKSSQTKK